VNKEAGAANLTIGELVMEHGSALRLHTHPTDEAIILLEGRVEMVVGDERRVVSAGHHPTGATWHAPLLDQQHRLARKALHCFSHRQYPD
jgi:uncharacterized cupin superfamily protein